MWKLSILTHDLNQSFPGATKVTSGYKVFPPTFMSFYLQHHGDFLTVGNQTAHSKSINVLNINYLSNFICAYELHFYQLVLLFSEVVCDFFRNPKVLPLCNSHVVRDNTSFLIVSLSSLLPKLPSPPSSTFPAIPHIYSTRQNIYILVSHAT